jgi:hypothetical protein
MNQKIIGSFAKMINCQNQSNPFNGLHWIVEDAVYLNNYQVKAWFRDGSVKVVDFEKFLLGRKEGSIFEPLKDVKYFSTLQYSEEISTIHWDNGADIAPEWLYQNGIDVSGTYSSGSHDVNLTDLESS